MTNVLRLCLQERVDPGCDDLLDAQASLLDELAMQLYHASEDAGALERVADLSSCLGLGRLELVAGQLRSLHPDDRVSRPAVAARLLRVGEASILALWDRQDRSL